MKYKTYTFMFKGGPITVRALNQTEAAILAQAEAIQRGWDYTILTSLEYNRYQSKTYRIYYKKGSKCQSTDMVFKDKLDAHLRCVWLNENTAEGVFGKFYYEEEIQ